MHFYSRMCLSELNNPLAIIKHTIEGHVGGVLHERAASEVDQLDFQRVRVHQEVLQFYITMEDATLTANVSGMNDLPHNLPPSHRAFVGASLNETSSCRAWAAPRP